MHGSYSLLNVDVWLVPCLAPLRSLSYSLSTHPQLLFTLLPTTVPPACRGLPPTLEPPDWYRQPEASRSFISPPSLRQQGACTAYQGLVRKGKSQALFPPCKALNCDLRSRAPCGIRLRLGVCLKSFLALLIPFLYLDSPTALLISPRRHFLNKALASKSLTQDLLLGKLAVLKLQDVPNAQLLVLQCLKQEFGFCVYQEQL